MGQRRTWWHPRWHSELSSPSERGDPSCRRCRHPHPDLETVPWPETHSETRDTCHTGKYPERTQQTHTHRGQYTHDKRVADGTVQTRHNPPSTWSPLNLNICPTVVPSLLARYRWNLRQVSVGRRWQLASRRSLLQIACQPGALRTKLLYTGSRCAGLLFMYFLRGSEQGRGSL